jgi:hypothetical protein
MSENQSIKDTLEVIRNALEDEKPSNIDNFKENILVLNQLVKEDGTINIINNSLITKEDVMKSLNEKIDNIFEKNFNKWLDKNMTYHLEKYFKNKEL